MPSCLKDGRPKGSFFFLLKDLVLCHFQNYVLKVNLCLWLEYVNYVYKRTLLEQMSAVYFLEGCLCVCVSFFFFNLLPHRSFQVPLWFFFAEVNLPMHSSINFWHLFSKLHIHKTHTYVYWDAFENQKPRNQEMKTYAVCLSVCVVQLLFIPHVPFFLRNLFFLMFPVFVLHN